TKCSFNSTDKYIQFITQIQTDFRNMVAGKIGEGTERLHDILSGYKKKLWQLEMAICGMNDIRFPKRMEPTNPFEVLKTLVLKKLAKERLQLSNIETMV